MRKFIAIAALLPSLAFGQVSFIGDSIKIETPAPTGMQDFQISVQNADALNESIYYWSGTGTGTFYAPWCNVRVSRTAFDSNLLAISEWSVELKKVNVSVKVSAMPQRKILVEVHGGNFFDLKTRHVSYGNFYLMYEGMTQYFQAANNLSEGQHIIAIPYRIHGEQAAIVTVHGQGCSQTVGRIFYLN